MSWLAQARSWLRPHCSAQHPQRLHRPSAAERWQRWGKPRALLRARRPRPAVITAAHTGDSSLMRQLRLRCSGESTQSFAQG